MFPEDISASQLPTRRVYVRWSAPLNAGWAIVYVDIAALRGVASYLWSGSSRFLQYQKGAHSVIALPDYGVLLKLWQYRPTTPFLFGSH